MVFESGLELKYIFGYWVYLVLYWYIIVVVFFYIGIVVWIMIILGNKEDLYDKYWYV